MLQVKLPTQVNVEVHSYLQISDRYGSPSMDEVETFARAFNQDLEAALGEEEAGAITVEVSSPVSASPADAAE